MSATSTRRGLTLVIALAAAALLSACGKDVTAPTQPLKAVKTTELAESCPYGWVLINGVCQPEG